MTTTDVLHVHRSDGARIEAQVSGLPDAPTVLLLQGQASSHYWWTRLRDRFEHRFRTVTMDYRGTGRTAAPDGDLSTHLLAEDAVAVLDKLGVRRTHVYGTSMGGRVAQMLAAHHAARVQSLVLACTSPGGPRAVERGNDIRKALANPDTHARMAAMVELFYTPAWGDHPDRSHLFGDASMSPAARQRHLKMSARHDAWNLLPQIGCRTLVLHGADDQMTPLVNAELIADRIPRADVHIHPTGRHGFFDEFADDLDPVLDGFWG